MLAGWLDASGIGFRSFQMKNRLLISTVVAASLLAPAVAFAQTSAPPDSTGPSAAESTAPHATKTAPAAHHAKATHMKRGTTVGMSPSTSRSRPGSEAAERKPAY